jgi:GNAT superfamily N-acetyltransferase
MTAELLDPLFLNHLAFLAAHRGAVSVGLEGATIASEIPGFSSFTPLCEHAALPQDCTAVRLLPQSGASWLERLKTSGFAPAEALAYMVFSAPAPPPRAAEGCRIIRACSEAQARVFADVQYQGFFDPAEEGAPAWLQRFIRAASANVPRADQSFLIALQDGAPAAVALIVRAAGVDGLYAVATAPQFRRQGLSTHLLRQASEEAHGRGRALILQVHEGSYARGFYARLGFEARYVSQVWRRG